jgi:hypothetical protein
MDQLTKRTGGKSLYSPPQLTTISLRPEEAVLGACKSLNTGGHTGSGGCVFFSSCPTNNAGS